jgi:hypothetical protein
MSACTAKKGSRVGIKSQIILYNYHIIQYLPWITPTIISKINVKNRSYKIIRSYKKFVKSKNRETKHQFTQIKNEITSLTRKSKEEYYRKYFEKHDKNSKKIWNGIKEIINIKQKSSSLPSIIIDKDKMLTNQKEIANHFNCYFSGIAGNILKSRKHKGNHSYQEYLKKSSAKFTHIL